MTALRTIEHSVLGTNWHIEVWPVDGYSIWVTDSDNNTLYNKRVIDDSLFDAICTVAWQVWQPEIDQYQDYELPRRIAYALGFEEPEDEELSYELAFIADPQGGGYWAVLKDGTEVFSSPDQDVAQTELDALLSA